MSKQAQVWGRMKHACSVSSVAGFGFYLQAWVECRQHNTNEYRHRYEVGRSTTYMQACIQMNTIRTPDRYEVGRSMLRVVSLWKSWDMNFWNTQCWFLHLLHFPVSLWKTRFLAEEIWDHRSDISELIFQTQGSILVAVSTMLSKEWSPGPWEE